MLGNGPGPFFNSDHIKILLIFLIISPSMQLYKNLWSTVMQGDQVLERPSWWKEFCSDKPVVGSLYSKL